MNIRILLLIFILLIPHFLYPQTGWHKIYPFPTTESINTSSFINSGTGWLSAGNELLKTSDGGISWLRNLKSDNGFVSIFFTNENTGWVASYREIFKTTNSGANWVRLLNIDTISINRLFFINSSTGWVSAQTGMLKSTDGGITWNSFGGINFPIKIIYFKNSNTGFAGWGNFSSKILMTTNSGTNWDTVLRNYDAHDLKFINQMTGFISAYTGKILKTTNGGYNWYQVFNSGLTWNFETISFVDSLNGWVSGDRYGVLARTSDCGQNWIQLNTGIAHWINSSAFTDLNTGWLFSDNGDIYKTTNAGINFYQQSKSLNSNLNSVFFTDVNTGYACGYYDSAYYPYEKNIILKSTNGGMNWNTILNGYNGILYSLSFINQNTGFCGNGTGKIFRTSNAGITWDTGSLSGNNSINDFYFLNQATGWIAYGAGIYKTTNSGLNWSSQYNGQDIECIYFLNENTGWAGGYWTKYIKTTNGGENWTDQTLPVGFQSFVTSTYFLDANTGFAISTGYLCKTTNGGNNWTYLSNMTDLLKIIFKGNTGWILDYFCKTWKTTNRGESWIRCTDDSTGSNANSFFFIDQNTGWIAGRNSFLSKTTNSGVWVRNNETNLPYRFSISQNYPNPFNSETKIKFSIKKYSDVKLEIYDIKGMRLSLLINEKMGPGTYDIIWSADNYPSGVYFYKINAEDYYETKKMILIK